MDRLFTSPLTLLVFVILGLVVLRVIVKYKKRGLTFGVYRRSPELFSAAERKFLVALDGAVAPQARVFGKVRVADLVHLKSGLSANARQGALNRVAQKHFDFVICSVGTLVPLCAVELNDRSHGSDKAMRRDALLAGICNSIGLPIVTVPAAASYSQTALKELIAKATMHSNEGGARNGA